MHGGLLTTVISALSRGSASSGGGGNSPAGDARGRGLFSRSNSLIAERPLSGLHTVVSPTNSLNVDGSCHPTGSTSGHVAMLPCSEGENGVGGNRLPRVSSSFRSTRSFLSVDYIANHVTWAGSTVAVNSPGSGMAQSPMGSSENSSQFSRVRYFATLLFFYCLKFALQLLCYVY